MSDQPPTPIDQETLERYLDGLLSPKEARQVEDRLAADPAALEQVVAQRRMVAGLTQMFDQRADATPLTLRAQPRVSTGRIAAAAAVLVLAGAAVWVLAPRPKAPELVHRTDAQWKQQTLTKLREQYQFHSARAFKPDEVCTTDEQFAAWTHRAFGVALRPSRTTAGVQPVYAGWCRTSMFSSYTGVLLATVDGQPVIVAMDVNVPQRRIPADDTAGPLKVFVRSVGNAQLFEVTPRNTPGVIDRLELAPAPPEPQPH